MKQTVTENEFIHGVMEIDDAFSREGLKLVFNYLEECGESDFCPKDVSMGFVNHLLMKSLKSLVMKIASLVKKKKI